jgi:hypothetical protein
LVDFKFTNDTPYWILMETYMGSGSLTWKFYSTKDGRTVTWDTTGVTDVVPAPSPSFEENPELRKNEMKQVDWAANGADVTVTRTVMRDGAVWFQDHFTTHYQPWQAILVWSGFQEPRSWRTRKELSQSFLLKMVNARFEQVGTPLSEEMTDMVKFFGTKKRRMNG